LFSANFATNSIFSSRRSTGVFEMNTYKLIASWLALPTLFLSTGAQSEPPAQPTTIPTMSTSDLLAAATLCYEASSVPGPIDTGKMEAAGWRANAVPANLQTLIGGERAYSSTNNIALIGLIQNGRMNGCKVTGWVHLGKERDAVMASFDKVFKTSRSGDSTPDDGRWIWLMHMARAGFGQPEGDTFATVLIISSKLQ
jgi:hypothetical protein